jgi:biotin carboxylase
VPRLLLLATTTGYQTRAFEEASSRRGVELVYATDRCDRLDDPWADRAIPIRFHEPAESVAAIVDFAERKRIDAVLAVGDRPATLGALVCEALELPGHAPVAAAAASHKLRTREHLHAAGLPVPWFREIAVDDDISGDGIQFPCVLKPVSLSGSRGVMRADDHGALRRNLDRLRRLLKAPDVQSERNREHGRALIEEFIEGSEYAVEAVLTHGRLRLLAIFDKPDPLDGPFFEETIYLTPSSAPHQVQNAIVDGVRAAARAIGLSHGPVHAECRVNDRGVYVLEVAARPIGGLCARALAFEYDGAQRSLEDVLLAHAMGDDITAWRREPKASGVMMIPIPRAGIFRGASGVDRAREVAWIDDVQITAKVDQRLVPLPEGASYLGFIFARAPSSDAVDGALRAAHRSLQLAIDPELPMVESGHG